MSVELRLAFHEAMGEIDAGVTQLFALVSEGLANATDAFLAGDRERGRALQGNDAVIDALYRRVEELVQREMSLQQPMAGDLRFLLSVLRIVPELERSGDLVEHIAAGAARGIASELTPRIRGLIEQMGAVGVELWRHAADAYAERDATAGRRMEEMDDELDELHSSVSAEIASGQVSVPVAMEMALIVRFYERLGDHAVNIAERMAYLAGPASPALRGRSGPAGMHRRAE